MKTKNVYWAMPAAALLALTATGCPEDAADKLCCTESDFQVGGTIEMEGEPRIILHRGGRAVHAGAVHASSLLHFYVLCRMRDFCQRPIG